MLEDISSHPTDHRNLNTFRQKINHLIFANCSVSFDGFNIKQSSKRFDLQCLEEPGGYNMGDEDVVNSIFLAIVHYNCYSLIHTPQVHAQPSILETLFSPSNLNLVAMNETSKTYTIAFMT